MASMQGKVVAITGAASGIGLATAKILYERGASLSLADQSSDMLHSAASAIQANGSSNQKITTTVLDVRKSDQVNAWIAGTVRDHGKLDCAANLAGVINKIVPFDNVTDEDWELVMGVNCTGVFNCMRAEVAAMTQPGGSIVNASSVAGLIGIPRSGPYTASKHAIAGLTKSVAREVGARGIRVNAVAPGATETPMTERIAQMTNMDKVPTAHSALNRMADPAEIAKGVAHLLSDEASFQTGCVMTVDGGWIC